MQNDDQIPTKGTMILAALALINAAIHEHAVDIAIARRAVRRWWRGNPELIGAIRKARMNPSGASR